MAIVERVSRAPEGVPPWFVLRAATLAAAVGRVNVGGHGFGTGFLIAPQLLLTCWHVVSSIDDARKSKFELDYHRGEDGAFGKVTTVDLDPDAVYTADRTLDFAIVALQRQMNGRPVIPLGVEGDETPGERVTIFQHAQGGPLQVSLRDGMVIDVFDNVLHHTANTQPGSAGAPLLDESLRLIGLHHAAVPRTDERLARAREEGSFSGPSLANEAIRATAILYALAMNAPQLLGRLNIKGSLVPEGHLVEPAPGSVPAPTETLSSESPQRRDTVFISYAHDDQGRREWRKRLRTFLMPLDQDLDVWDDTRIHTGAEWRNEIEIALKRTRVAVLLVGPEFLASEFITGQELPPLLDAAGNDGAVILPLITNHCAYDRSPLAKYQSFNAPDHPLESMERPAQNRVLQKFAEEVDDAFHGRRKR